MTAAECPNCRCRDMGGGGVVYEPAPTEPTKNGYVGTLASKYGTNGCRSHSVNVLNPPREDMVKTDIRVRIDDAVAEVVEELMGLVEDGTYTDDEVRSGLRGRPDFQDAWNDREPTS